VIVKPAGSASIRGSEDFQHAHEVAGKVNGGGHPQAAGCKPDIYDDMLDYAQHWTTEGQACKRVILAAFEAVAEEVAAADESDETEKPTSRVVRELPTPSTNRELSYRPAPLLPLMTDILVAGETLVDLLPGRGETLHDVDGFTHRPGGAPANVAVGLTRLGSPPAFWTRLGDDPLGDFLRETLDEEGVPDALSQRVAGNTTLAVVSPPGVDGRRFRFTARGT